MAPLLHNNEDEGARTENIYDEVYESPESNAGPSGNTVASYYVGEGGL